MPDKISIVCSDCGATFVLTEKEQKWFRDRGFVLPKRCKECRSKRKADGGRNNVK